MMLEDNKSKCESKLNKSDKFGRKRMKGLEIGIESFIGGMLVLGLIVVIFNLFIGRYFDIKTILNENAVDRHAIAFGNVLLSSDKIAYSDDMRTYRGIFDKIKLDEEMINQNNFMDFMKIFQQSEMLKEISYPDSLIGVNVVDKETGESWMLFGYGKMSIQAFSSTVYGECLFNKLKPDAQTVFRALSNTLVFGPVGLTKIWDNYDLKTCENELGDRLGTSYNTFPVAIRISDNEVHAGVLNLRITEY